VQYPAIFDWPARRKTLTAAAAGAANNGRLNTSVRIEVAIFMGAFLSF
jgi:hypothetical protein